MSRDTREYRPKSLTIFAYGTFTLCGLSFQNNSTNYKVFDSPKSLQRPPSISHYTSSTTLAGLHDTGLGSFPFARRYLGNRFYFLFLELLRCFNSLSLPLSDYVFIGKSSDITRKGLPHSEIPGSKDVCSSPRLIAAGHVLHRLLVPRHPPYALSSLTTIPCSHINCSYISVFYP